MEIQTIRNLNKGTWRKFVAYCKLKGINVGVELTDVLDKDLDKNFKRLLK